MNLKSFNEDGYVALMSTIIMTLILLGLTFTFSSTSYFARFDTLHGEFKRVALGLSESCVNSALLKIGQNPNYPGPETVTVGSSSCFISSVTYVPSSGYDASHEKVATIIAKASYRGAYSTIVATAKIRNQNTALAPGVHVIDVNSWAEMPE